MSKLIVLLCFVCIASTVNAADRDDTVSSVEKTIASSISEVEKQYATALERMMEIADKIKSRGPLKFGAEKVEQNPEIPKECRGYIAAREERNMAIVDECADREILSSVRALDKLKDKKADVLDELHSYETQIRGCVKNEDGSTAKVDECISTVSSNLSSFTTESSKIFTILVEHLQQVLDNYLSTVGRCIASKDTPRSYVQWIQACIHR